MTAPTYRRGAAPRHLELARQAIRRAERDVEPLEQAIVRAIEAALREAGDVADMTGDGRKRVMARTLAILRIRQAIAPSDLTTVLGYRDQKQASAALRRLAAVGYAARTSWGTYVARLPKPTGRPRNTDRPTPRTTAA